MKHATDMTTAKEPRKQLPDVAPTSRDIYGPRHVYGPRPIGALVPALTRPAFRKRAPGAAQVMADWAQIVGPELSARTTPRRLTGGTLTLACAGPVALELQHLSDQLLARVNGHLGRMVVERLRFVQDPIAVAKPLPVASRKASKAVELPGIAPGPLHDALSALAQRLASVEQA